MRLPLTIAGLILLPMAIYARVATFDYVQADDTDLIRGNISFLQDLGNAAETFSRSYFETAGQTADRKTYYRPFVIVSFMLDAQVSGAEPRQYHITNVAVHIVVVLLLFALLRSLGAGDRPAFVSAALFAVHPANVQAVAWIPGRNDTLMAAFALASLIALVRYYLVVGPHPHGLPRLAVARRADSSVDPESLRHRWAGPGWLALHVAAFAAALFTKESALALVVLNALYISLWRDPGRRHRRLAPVLAIDLLAVAIWYAMRQSALAGDDAGIDVSGALSTAARNAPHLLVYAGKIALPVHLSVMPGLTWIDAALGLASLALVAWLLSRLERPRRWFIAAWILLFLAPALLIPGLPAYEHRLYIPLIALAVAVASLPVWRAGDHSRRIAAAGMTAATLYCAGMAFAYTSVFRDRHTYWRSATSGTPHAGIAHVNLGQIYEAEGNTTRAGEQYAAALAVDPATPGAHNNLGVLAARAGRFDAAMREFDLEIRLHPANADAYFNVGLIHKLAGRLDEAAAWWERTLGVQSAHVAAHQELAAYYAGKGDAARAALHLDRARALAPTGDR